MLNRNEIEHLIAISDKRIDEINKETEDTYKDLTLDEELKSDIISTNNAVVDILNSAINKLSSIQKDF